LGCLATPGMRGSASLTVDGRLGSFLAKAPARAAEGYMLTSAGDAVSWTSIVCLFAAGFRTRSRGSPVPFHSKPVRTAVSKPFLAAVILYCPDLPANFVWPVSSVDAVKIN